MSSVRQIATYLVEHHKEISNSIVDAVINGISSPTSPDEIERARENFSKLLNLTGTSLLASSEEIEKDLVEWSQKVGEHSVHSGEKIGKTLEVIPLVRSTFIQRIGQLCIEHGLPTTETLQVIEKLNYTLDIAVNETMKAFDYFKDKIISAAYEEVSELSAPIVPILQGIAVLPLIGSIDSHKANHILHNVIPKVAELKLNCLIIDFSGIHIIDTMVTDHIFKIHRILRLLGTKAVLTGIRPSLAQTAVGIGIDFSSIKTYATVQQALESTHKQIK